MPTGRNQPVKVKEEDEDQQQQLERNPAPGDGATGTPLSLKGEDFNFENDCDQKWQPGVSGEGKRRREEGDDGNMEEEDVVLTESEDSDDDVLVVLECEGDDADWALFRDDDDDDEDDEDYDGAEEEDDAEEDEEEEEEATVGSSSSPSKAAGQPQGSAASGEQGSTGADEEGGPWLDESTEDHLPPQPEFQPLRTPGPQITQGVEYTTLQLFRLFFTDAVLRTLVRNTNKYGAIRHAARWTDITPEDLFSYLSLLIYMGMTKMHCITDYWRQVDLYNFRFPRSVMPCLKFQLINTAIHMSDPDDDAANKARRGTAEYDCLHKLKPMYTELREACKTNFHPYQHIGVGEREVCSTVQDPQNKYGYKWFVLGDSRCGYMWDFHMNEGRPAMARDEGLSYDCVMELVSAKALGSGYKLYVVDDLNNSSPELFKDLLQQKVWACGTVRPNTKGFPTNRPGSLDKKSPRGAIRWIREDPLLFVQWRDKYDGHMCSTMHQAHAGQTIQRKVKGANGMWSTQKIPVPPAVKDYIERGDKADLSDVVTRYYNLPTISRKWYRSLFFDLIDIAIVNAFVLYREIAQSNKGDTPKTQKAFREELVEQLARAGSPTTRFATAPPSSSSAPVGGMHLPVYLGEDATRVRKRCIVCQLKTPISCQSCDLPFCFVSDRNCYHQWHMQNVT